MFERVVRSLHGAAFDDAAWPAASGLIDEACGSKGNMLVSGEGGMRGEVDVLFARYCYRGERRADREREYFEVWHALDERVPRLRRLPDSRIVHVDALYSETERKRSPVYNEMLGASDTGNCLHARLDGPDGSRIVWTVADPVDADGWTSGRIETIGHLLPHLRQFVRVRQALAGARALAASFSALLDNAGVGVVQLDRRGCMMVANERARALLNEPGGLYDRHGRLYASWPWEDRQLQGLLARALPPPGETGAGGSMPLSRPAPRPRLAVHVSPVDASGVNGGGTAPPFGALVLAVDPADRPGLDPERVAQALGLTPAESRIAVSLAQGRTIDEIAAASGRSRTTVKWHIGHIYEKHGLSRQIELAQLVMSVADAWAIRR